MLCYILNSKVHLIMNAFFLTGAHNYAKDESGLNQILLILVHQRFSNLQWSFKKKTVWRRKSGAPNYS